MRQASVRLAEAGITDPPREASSLLALALERDRTFLIAHPEYQLTSAEEETFNGYLARRASREPLQYIRGTQEFYGLEFEVTPEVLIPRPETELLVETAIALLRDFSEPVICDVGTGSGCIAISVAHEVKMASGIALDISPDALKVAARNAKRHGVDDRLRFTPSDVFSGLTNERFDLVVSNPPYVHSADIDHLQPEVRDFEPIAALTDGADGLSIIERIVCEAPEFLKPGGYLLLEVGFGQAEEVKSMFAAEIWSAVELIPDLQSIPRVVKGSLMS
jgi:release factor glutamine methyltransferase